VRLFKKNESAAARRDLFVVVLDEADYATPKSGLTLSVEIVKAGATSFAAVAGSSAEVGTTGTYRIALAAGGLDTLGEAMLRISAWGAVTQFVPLLVVGYDPYDAAGLGLSELHLAKAALANKRTHAVETGVNAIKDDDGETTLLTLTPSEAGGVVMITPS
jgi:hypothetical protein